MGLGRLGRTKKGWSDRALLLSGRFRLTNFLSSRNCSCECSLLVAVHTYSSLDTLLPKELSRFSIVRVRLRAHSSTNVHPTRGLHAFANDSYANTKDNNVHFLTNSKLVDVHTAPQQDVSGGHVLCRLFRLPKRLVVELRRVYKAGLPVSELSSLTVAISNWGDTPTHNSHMGAKRCQLSR